MAKKKDKKMDKNDVHEEVTFPKRPPSQGGRFAVSYVSSPSGGLDPPTILLLRPEVPLGVIPSSPTGAASFARP